MKLEKIEKGIYRIKIRLGAAAVNAYLIDRGLPTLVDTGPSIEDGFSQLQEGLREAGRPLHQIQRIFFTHLHGDHFGAARKIKEASGAELFCFEEAKDKLEDYEQDYENLMNFRAGLLQKSGVPDDIIKKIRPQLVYYGGLGESASPDRLFRSSDEFQLGEVSLKAIHTPGHTPLCTSYYLKELKTLFSGDFILTLITPNPTAQPIDAKYYRPLAAYLDSLRKIKTFDLSLILPAHGDPIWNPKARIAEICDHHEIRKARLYDLIRGEKKTPFQLHMDLFNDRTPGQVSLGISEVTAHLELLESEGKVKKEMVSGTLYFSSVSS
jgi:glyoxylase-like metal-dependent hydrolase (beta-lactamase superfamily II)